LTGAELNELSDKVRAALSTLMPENVIFLTVFFEEGTTDTKLISNMVTHQVGASLREVADEMDKHFLVTRN
jgi:hypothetical protein